MTKWEKIFAEATNMDELKKAYKKACMSCHPDKGGTAAEFKAMSAAHDKRAAEIAKGEAGQNLNRNKKADGSFKTFEEIFQEQKAFMAVIEQLINLEGLELEICGSWLWIGGNTYEHRAAIKEAGCKFASKKKMWYWHAGEWVKKIRREFTMEEIRDLHGSEKLQQGHRMFIPAAAAPKASYAMATLF